MNGFDKEQPVLILLISLIGKFDGLDCSVKTWMDLFSHFKTPIRFRVDEESQSADLQGTPCRQNRKRKVNKTDFQSDLKMDVWNEDVPSDQMSIFPRETVTWGTLAELNFYRR